jgi:hypothetical protein
LRWTRQCGAASESKVEASTHAVAVNRRDSRGGEVGYGLHQPLAHAGKAERFRAMKPGDFMKVGSGGKEMCVACDDEGGGRLPGEIG